MKKFWKRFLTSRFHKIFLTAGLSLWLLAALSGPSYGIKCDVAVVGGGAAGVHTAYQLTKPEIDAGTICLFEKEDHLGGRIKDVDLGGGGVFGTGALRFHPEQTVVVSLANELGIEAEEVPYGKAMANARGQFLHGDFPSEGLLDFYGSPIVGLFNDFPMRDDSVLDIYHKILCEGDDDIETNSGVPDYSGITSDKYPDFRSYLRQVIGEEGYQWFRDSFRFRSDSEANIDARSYLEYLAEEWNVRQAPLYPIGGMSEFITRMAESITANGGIIFLGTPATAVNKRGTVYKLSTPTGTHRAEKVVLALPPTGLKHVKGNIGKAIKAQKQFQALNGSPVTTIAHRWNTKWWDGGNLSHPSNSDPGNGNISRAWTVNHCLNFIEFPVADYAADQLVTRTVFNDQAQCVKFWKRTHQQHGDAGVNAEILRGLRYLFPIIFTGVSEPQIMATAFQHWPAAWYLLRGAAGYTNQEIFDWAVSPLSGENVFLASDAYHPNRFGWSDAAYKSSINVLNTHFGLGLPTQGKIPLNCNSDFEP